jgi:flagellin
MPSILTNNSALTALSTLNSTNRKLEITQDRISTGLRVSSASDNAAYWSIATTMRSDNAALSTVQDALGLGSATIDVAYTAMKSAIDITSEIKSKLIAARQPGVNRADVQAEIATLQDQLTGVANSATFSGQNWLSVDSSAASFNGTKNVVASFSRDAAGAVSVSTIDIDTSTMVLFDSGAGATEVGVLDANRDATGAVAAAGTFSVATLDISALTDSSADITTLNSYIAGVDAAIDEMTTGASDLGAAKKRISLQKDFVSALMGSIERGIGQLVDADMNEESTRLQALQVQQQLGIQALSIANSGAQNILSLFR